MVCSIWPDWDVRLLQTLPFLPNMQKTGWRKSIGAAAATSAVNFSVPAVNLTVSLFDYIYLFDVISS